MKFNGPMHMSESIRRDVEKSKAWFERHKDWKQWYAWFPVRIGKTREFRWLEHIERRRIDDWFGGHWEYRVILKP